MPTSFDVLLKNWLSKISHSVKGVSISGDTMTVTKTDNSTEDLTLGLQALEKKIFAQSTWYKRPQLMTAGTVWGHRTEITIYKGTQVAINGNLYVSTQDVTISISTLTQWGTERAGKDVYVYACVPASGTEPVFVASLNSTVPSGYTAETSRKIGGFHCLCYNVGVIENHPLSGYFTGEILPASVWDLLHRAESENEGMVCVNGKWYDIYLPSGLRTALKSEYNATIRNYYSGDWFAEGAMLVKKRLISREEFVLVSQGSNQMTNIMGSARPTTTGGHVDTANQRMVSNYGVEDCCGTIEQWSRDIFGAPNAVDTSTYSGQGNLSQTTSQVAKDGDTPANAGTQEILGYVSQLDGRGTYNVYDGDNTVTNQYGLATGALVRLLLGGAYFMTTRNGSRYVNMKFLSSYVNVGNTARLMSDARIVNL